MSYKLDKNGKRIFTLEHRAKISAGGKGKKRSKATRLRMSIAAKKAIAEGRAIRGVNAGTFKKGHRTWNKGLKGVQKAWNKGLTKDDHPSLLKLSISCVEAMKHRESHFATYNRKAKKGQKLSAEYRAKISKSMKIARASYARPWNTGLSKYTDSRVALLGKTISKSTKGKPRPFVSSKQGIRRFWYYGQHRNIKMRSRWEVKYAYWLDKRGLEWQYETITFVTPDFSYTPDFYLTNRRVFVEIKGYMNAHSMYKLGVVSEHYGVKILLLTESKLKKRGVL